MKIKIYLLVFICMNIIFAIKANEFNQKEIEILKNIRCLVCQGQSVADSNSDFANTVKLVVKDQIDQGKSEEEIYKFLISKYGEWITYRPRLSMSNSLLWFFPYLILIFGVLLIHKLTKKQKNS